ncbi:RFT1 family-containing protein [Strongyloides ratti]|uniref:Protein RFT1 homolog n=1 Tax=Strongyloides ratti TaxID=34506 RepID=A0A090LLZ0_STRRB|nr:RFT1 family-containing protein [Strongyloides ratti]CEF70716.1 RFT1 family-containing protein [Strongyloides ratti]
MINHFKYVSNIQIILKLLIFCLHAYFFKKLDKEIYSFFFFQCFLLKKLLFWINQSFFDSERCLINKKKFKLRSIILLIFVSLISLIWYNLVGIPNKIYKVDYIYLLLIFASSIFIEILFHNYKKLSFNGLSNLRHSMENDIQLLCQNGITFTIFFLKLLTPPYSLVIGYLLGYFLHFFILIIFKNVLKVFCQNYTYQDNSKNWVKEEKCIDININNTSNYHITFFIAKCLILLTNNFSLNNQAVLCIIECFGNLLVEILFEPTLRIGKKFINTSSCNYKRISDDEVESFKNVLKPFILLGLILGLFITPYSYLLTKLIGDDFLKYNQGDKLLIFYFNYLILLSIDCILKYFILSTLKKNENNIYKKYFYLIFGIIVIIYYFAYQYNNNIGLLTVNIFLTLINIILSFKQIYSIEKKFLTPISTFLPSLNGIILLIFGYLTTQLSFIIFAKVDGILNNLTHLSIGGIMFIVIIFQFVQNEFPKYNPIIFFQEKLHCQ